MAKADLSGVGMVLAGLTGDDDVPRREKAPAAPKPKPKRPVPSPNAKIEQNPEPNPEDKPQSPTRQPATDRPVTRMGRPPGRKSGEQPLKRKTTISLTADLMDEYAERSWEERCQLGELVERALAFYRDREWGRE